MTLKKNNFSYWSNEIPVLSILGRPNSHVTSRHFLIFVELKPGLETDLFDEETRETIMSAPLKLITPLVSIAN